MIINKTAFGSNQSSHYQTTEIKIEAAVGQPEVRYSNLTLAIF
jgi:hypothetical protein